MSTAAVLALAAAVLLGGGSGGRARLRGISRGTPGPAAEGPVRPAWIALGGLAVAAVVWATVGGTSGAIAGTVTGAAVVAAVRRLAGPRERDEAEPAELAACWELVAVCLQAGLPVAVAVAAAAERLAGGTGGGLRRVAGLLTLGADHSAAWEAAEAVPGLATFARAAGRSAATGAALAEVARAEGARLRAGLADTAQARAQRAAVLITGPLGLCFLPAFLVLGIAPVVIGLAEEALARWT